MKIPDPDRHEFLHELFESERGDCGPTAEQVSRLVREERERRSRRRGFATAAAVVAVMGAFATFHLRTARMVGIADIPQESPAILNVAESAITPASFPIEKVDDAGLLEMLKDQPVALVALPNGERRLMMIVQAPRGADNTARR